jgi:hypothetical protein
MEGESFSYFGSGPADVWRFSGDFTEAYARGNMVVTDQDGNVRTVTEEQVFTASGPLTTTRFHERVAVRGDYMRITRLQGRTRQEHVETEGSFGYTLIGRVSEGTITVDF